MFFVQQKTAYERRISDWSSDVCSSDLTGRRSAAQRIVEIDPDIALDQFGRIDLTGRHRTARIVEIGARIHDLAADADRPGVIFGEQRSEERRVGKECVSTCR